MNIWMNEWMNEWMVFQATNAHCRGYTGPGATLANEMNSWWNMPQVQDQSVDLLTCSPQHYTTVSWLPLYAEHTGTTFRVFRSLFGGIMTYTYNIPMPTLSHNMMIHLLVHREFVVHLTKLGHHVNKAAVTLTSSFPNSTHFKHHWLIVKEYNIHHMSACAITLQGWRV